MDIELYNTLTRKKEKFSPARRTLFGTPRVSMYHCGPTVYDYVHIGNLRAAVFADTMRRLFEGAGYKVSQVMNITDVGHLTSDADEGEDKITRALVRAGKPLTLKAMKEHSEFYAQAFIENIQALNVKVPHKLPRASEHIREDIAIVKKLEAQGLTYTTSTGVYFDTSKINDYGKLGGLSEAHETESRIGIQTDKRNQRDFSLWKLNTALGWPSPWGRGFPGWHIECSAMAMKYLGETIDIHTGGIEHIPIHHNNEIAQSEHATKKSFVRFWIHNGHLVIDNEKMAKSGKFVTLQTIREQKFDPMALRYFFLGARYSTQLNFTWEALGAAETAYKRLDSAVCELPSGGKVNEPLWQSALRLLGDDLDTPKVLALVWDILKDASLPPADKKATILKIDELLGLAKIKKDKKSSAIPEEVSKLAKERESARAAKDWKKSDELRGQIAKLGYEVKDTPEGQKVSAK